MISGGRCQSEIHNKQVVIHGVDHHGISRPNQSRCCQSCLLRQGNTIGRTVQICEICNGEHPLECGSPEMNMKRSGWMIYSFVYDVRKLTGKQKTLQRCRECYYCSCCSSCYSCFDTQTLNLGLTLRFVLQFVLNTPSELIKLSRDVKGMTSKEQVISWLYQPCKSHEQRTINNECSRHWK